MPYIQRTPTFDAIRWTGSNQAEVAQAVGDYHDTYFTASVLDDGSLELVAGQFIVTVPSGYWYVMGPIYNGYPTGASSLVDDTTFAAQYQSD